MPKLTLYHNPRCSKSRAALALLEEAGHTPELVEYLKTPLDAKQLGALCKKLGIAPRKLLRSGEAIYKELGLAANKQSDADILAIMAKHPILMERPVLETETRAIIGRPPENVLELAGA